MAIVRKTAARKTAPKAKVAKKATKTSKTAIKAAPSKSVATPVKRATTAAGRVPVNLTLAQAKRIQKKLSKVDTSFDFLDKKISEA